VNKSLHIIVYVVTLVIKGAIMALRFSEEVHKRSLKRLVAMAIDAEDKVLVYDIGKG
jgi:hypothetical protein